MDGVRRHTRQHDKNYSIGTPDNGTLTVIDAFSDGLMTLDCLYCIVYPLTSTSSPLGEHK